MVATKNAVSRELNEVFRQFSIERRFMVRDYAYSGDTLQERIEPGVPVLLSRSNELKRVRTKVTQAAERNRPRD